MARSDVNISKIEVGCLSSLSCMQLKHRRRQANNRMSTARTVCTSQLRVARRGLDRAARHSTTVCRERTRASAPALPAPSVSNQSHSKLDTDASLSTTVTIILPETRARACKGYLVSIQLLQYGSQTETLAHHPPPKLIQQCLRCHIRPRLK